MKSGQRKRKTVDPCEGCGLHRRLCLCLLIPSITLKTRLTLIIHAKELKRTTNSGRLALAALKNSEMIVRGGLDSRAGVDLTDSLLPGHRPLLFFPSDDALELTSELLESLSKDDAAKNEESLLPIQLLVPDGNWRQASKVGSRHPELSHVARVKITSVNHAKQHLRSEHMLEGMSTLEAIARAIGIIESVEAEALLLELYREKLERTLEGRAQSRGQSGELLDDLSAK